MCVSCVRCQYSQTDALQWGAEVGGYLSAEWHIREGKVSYLDHTYHDGHH